MNQTFQQKLVRIEEHVGKINTSCHPKIEAALDQDEAGVWRVAQNIGRRYQQYANPAGAFMRAILDQAYLTPKLAATGSPAPMSHIPRYQPAILTPEEVAANLERSRRWKLIQKWMAHPEVKELYWECRATCRNPDDPTNAEGAWIQETMLAAIEELQERSTVAA